MRLKSIPTVIAGVVLAFALVACGGDDDGGASGSPEEAVKEFLTAIAEGDGETACALASENALSELPEGQDCEEVLAVAAGGISDQDREDVANATYEVTDETEDTATVTATKAGEDGDSETFDVVLEDGSWKIDG